VRGGEGGEGGFGVVVGVTCFGGDEAAESEFRLRQPSPCKVRSIFNSTYFNFIY
jgi:hypothetical protein